MKIVISLADGATAAKIEHSSIPDENEMVEEIHFLSAETSQIVLDVNATDMVQVVDFA